MTDEALSALARETLAKVIQRHRAGYSSDEQAEPIESALSQQAEEIERLKAELRQIDAVMAHRPALDKPTRWENIEHACSTAGRMSDRVVRLEREVASLRAELEQAQVSNRYWLKANAPGGWIDDLRQALKALRRLYEERSTP